jgi:hypothetical protein
MKAQEHHITIEWLTSLREDGEGFFFTFEGLLDERIRIRLPDRSLFDPNGNEVYHASDLPIQISFTESELSKIDRNIAQINRRTEAEQKQLDTLAELAVQEQVRACWIFKRQVFQVEIPCEKQSRVPRFDVPADEIAVRIKYLVYDKKQNLERMRREIEGYESGNQLELRREPIPESVRIFVWRRDNACCVACGSKERLEFDHIIPVIEGGSSTDRNVQLLCEACNRRKGKRV